MVERTRMNRAELVRLARLGAEERLRTLTSEIDAIYRHFPELRRPTPPADVGGGTKGRKPTDAQVLGSKAEIEEVSGNRLTHGQPRHRPIAPRSPARRYDAPRRRTRSGTTKVSA